MKLISDHPYRGSFTMSRKQFATAAVVLSLSFVLVGSAAAQTVKVVDKPGNGGWDISFNRKFGPDVFELDTFKKTKAEALQEAERLKVWSNSMDANSSWRLSVILIEGEDARPTKSKSGDSGQGGEQGGPKVLDPLQRLLEANNKIMDDLQKTLTDINKEDVKKALEKKRMEVKDAYERVKKAKEFMVKNVSKIADDDFKQVNGLIASYNGKVDTYKSEQYGSVFSNYPRINPVTPASFGKVQQWKQAKDTQAQLADDKQRLDGKKSRIDQEREALAQEGRSIQEEEARLKKLSDQANAGDGPYFARPTGDVIIPGKYHFINDGLKKFNSYDEARAFLDDIGRTDPKRYIFRDSQGNDVTGPPNKPDTTGLDKAEEELRQRKAEYKRRLQKYQQELLAGYNQEQSTHQSNIQSHAAVVQSLSQ
jgi:hypothetical protein